MLIAQFGLVFTQKRKENPFRKSSQLSWAEEIVQVLMGQPRRKVFFFDNEQH
jgi:hypothetical protein